MDIAARHGIDITTWEDHSLLAPVAQLTQRWITARRMV